MICCPSSSIHQFGSQGGKTREEFVEIGGMPWRGELMEIIKDMCDEDVNLSE